MFRKFLCSMAVLALLVASVAAADKDAKPEKDTKVNKDDKEMKATITKVDAKNKTITLKMKDKEGKETEKTFKLAEDIRYLDSNGKAIAIDVFRSGDEVLVIEREGKLMRVKKHEKEPQKDKKKDSGK